MSLIQKAILIYILVINIVTFAVYGIDKQRARKHKWRIPESVLILLAVLGGSIGALSGMIAFHHKTQKPKFVIGVPAILAVQLAIPIAAYFITV